MSRPCRCRSLSLMVRERAITLATPPGSRDFVGGSERTFPGEARVADLAQQQLPWIGGSGQDHMAGDSHGPDITGWLRPFKIDYLLPWHKRKRVRGLACGRHSTEIGPLKTLGHPQVRELRTPLPLAARKQDILWFEIAMDKSLFRHPLCFSSALRFSGTR